MSTPTTQHYTPANSAAACPNNRDAYTRCRQLRQLAKSAILQRTIARSAVTRFQCPKCGALPDQSCIGYRGRLRSANHLERVMVAVGWV